MATKLASQGNVVPKNKILKKFEMFDFDTAHLCSYAVIVLHSQIERQVHCSPLRAVLNVHDELADGGEDDVDAVEAVDRVATGLTQRIHTAFIVMLKKELC